MAAAPTCPRCNSPTSKDGVTDEGRQRYRCKSKACGWRGSSAANLNDAAGIDQHATKAYHRELTKQKDGCYVITSAQNATPVHAGFFASLQTYCRERGARLIVIPYRYKNPTSRWSELAEKDDWWAPEVVPYLLDRRLDLNANVRVLADIKTQPTASRPLEGYEAISGASSAIIGHPKLELMTVPTPQSKLPKIMTTTGTLTQRNYISSKAGKKAEFHHTFGACVVETVGKIFHLRQLNALEDGSFCDLDREYDGDAVRPIKSLGFIMGDTHRDFIDPKVVSATKDMLTVLQPQTLVWHDVMDFFSRNHHHRDDPFINFAKFHAGLDNVEAEVDRCFDFVDELSPVGTINIFVPSNHPDAMARWIRETDPREDPRNAIFWAKTFTAMCESVGWKPGGVSVCDPFAYWAKTKLRCYDRSLFLHRGESYSIKNIDISFHSDKGPNGGPGTRRSFAKIGVKTVIGHSHSPGICEGCYQVGTSTVLTMGYLGGGPSSWLQTHCVIYPNGKRSLINIIEGAWHAN